MILWAQEVGFDLSRIDAEGSLSSPAILAATLVSTCFLILSLSTVAWVWLRLNGWKVVRRVPLILLGLASYFLAAWIQFALGAAFYRAYYGLDSSVSVCLFQFYLCGCWERLAACFS